MLRKIVNCASSERRRRIQTSVKSTRVKQSPEFKLPSLARCTRYFVQLLQRGMRLRGCREGRKSTIWRSTNKNNKCDNICRLGYNREVCCLPADFFNRLPIFIGIYRYYRSLIFLDSPILTHYTTLIAIILILLFQYSLRSKVLTAYTTPIEKSLISLLLKKPE